MVAFSYLALKNFRQPAFSHSETLFIYFSQLMHWFPVIFLIQNSRDQTTRNRAVTGNREPAQPGCPLAKSSFHRFLRMQPPLPSRRQRAPQPSQPMAHTPPMAPFTWSTLCWLSCKSTIRIKRSLGLFLFPWHFVTLFFFLCLFILNVCFKICILKHSGIVCIKLGSKYTF